MRFIEILHVLRHTDVMSADDAAAVDSGSHLQMRSGVFTADQTPRQRPITVA